MLRPNLTTQLAVPALVVALAGIGFLVSYAGSTYRDRAVEQIVANGIDRLSEYRVLRSYYTKTVVEPARAIGLEVLTQHADKPNAIPLPATMIHELSERMREGESGFRLNLYSAFPFPKRQDRVLDSFAERALRRFERDPNGVFYELTEIEGERFVRVATADRMHSKACVECHNSHPDSPLKNWKLGDVRGVLEAELSAERILASAEEIESNLLVGGVMLSLALVSVVGLGMRRIGRRLREIVDILNQVASGDLDAEIGSHEPDELGAMKTLLEVAITNMRGDMESLHQSKVLMDSAPVNLIFCDTDHCVKFANPAACKAIESIALTSGIVPGELEGRSVEFLFGGDEEMREVLESGQWLPYRGVRPLGEEMLEVSVDEIDGLDSVRVGSLLTFDLVTEEHRNAELLGEAMEAERDAADRLRESFERERDRGVDDNMVATELRLKADRISEVVMAAASGDLTRRINLEGESPMDQIAMDLDQFLEDLATRVMQIREMSSALAATGHQLNSVGQSLVGGARRTSEEVGSVARAWTATNDGVDHMGVRVERLAKSYEEIAQNSHSAASVVSDGVVAANDARQAIDELDRSTQEIQLILTVIDQIADQSKLLALNASIEAARAGESGRGFNVVAKEVKKLASQTEEATQQISATVAQILDRGDRSGIAIRAMGEVMDQVDRRQGLITQTMVEQQSATSEVQSLAAQVGQRSSVIVSSIEQLSMVAESTENDAAGTDREAQKLLDLANQIGELTSRFVC